MKRFVNAMLNRKYVAWALVREERLKPIRLDLTSASLIANILSRHSPNLWPYWDAINGEILNLYKT